MNIYIYNNINNYFLYYNTNTMTLKEKIHSAEMLRGAKWRPGATPAV